MLNKVTLIGNLGADPESRTTAGGLAICSLRVATTSRVKQGDEWTDQTEWHRVTCFGKTAENAGRYLSKGRQVYVEGRIQTRKYQDKDGTDKWSTEIIADDIKFLGGNPDRAPAAAKSSGGPDDDIPFSVAATA